MRPFGARHTYLLLGGIVGAILLIYAEAKTFLAAQKYIDDLGEMPPLATPVQPPASRILSRTKVAGATAAAPESRVILRSTRLGLKE